MKPKINHYCWLGRNLLPGSIVGCIDSWKSSFLVMKSGSLIKITLMSILILIPYTREVYVEKMYAFGGALVGM